MAVSKSVEQTLTGHSLTGAERVERALLFMLLSLVPARAVIQERFSAAEPDWMRRIDAPIGPMPASTLIINLLVLVCAAVVCILRLRARGAGGGAPMSRVAYHTTGMEPGLCILAAAGVASTLSASNQAAAIIGSVDLCGLLVFFVALRQLLVSPWRVRLAVCVLLSTAALVTYKCFAQYFVEFPETIRQYHEGLGARMNAGDPAQQGAIYDFERRLEARTVSGFFAHSNVAATYLATAAAAALATGLARWRAGRSFRIGAFAPWLLAVLAAVALALARSKGAVFALLVGLVAWTIGARLVHGSRTRPSRIRPMTLVLLGWALAMLAGIAVVSIGITRGGLPTLSMLYRWQYWRGAWAMLIDGHAGGIGANNFGSLFTQYKPVECPEDVQDPHSWIVRAAVEWGWLGLAGIVAALVGASIKMSRPGGRPPADAVVDVADSSGGAMPRWLAGTLVMLVVSYVVAYTGGPGSAKHGSFVLSTAIELATVWLVAFACLSVEKVDVARFSNAALPAFAGGIGAAMLVFLLHSSIDLALFWPGAATTLMGWAAVQMASGRGQMHDAAAQPGKSGQPPPGLDVPKSTASHIGCVTESQGMGSRPAALATCVIATGLSLIVAWLLPGVYRSGRALLAARQIQSGLTWESLEQSGGLAAYEQAANADTRDPTPVDELLDELLGSPRPRAASPAQLDRAAHWVNELRRRDTLGSACDSHAARLAIARFESTKDPRHLAEARDAMRRLVGKYPSSPQRRIALAETLARLADVTKDSNIACEAAAQFRQALALDTARIYISAPNHLPAEQRRQLEQAANALCPGP